MRRAVTLHWLQWVWALLALSAVAFSLEERAQTNIVIAGARAQTAVVESLLDVWAFTTPGLSGDYLALGSSNVRPRLYTNTCDAAITDLVAEASDLVTAPDVVQYPLWAQPLAPVYNVPELSGIKIVFSNRIIARIFRGNLTYWNDPELKALNPALPLPAAKISRIPVLSLRGGMTDGITLYLSSVDEEWRSTVGRRPQVNWTAVSPAPFAQFTSPAAVSQAILTTSYSFSLQQFNQASQLGIQYGKMINKAGYVVEPTVQSVSFAILESSSQHIKFDGQPLNSIDSSTIQAWPMAIWNYLVLRKEVFRESCVFKSAAVRFFKWLLESNVAAQVAAEHSYVVLPDMLDNTLGVSAALEKDILCQGAPVLEASARADIQAIASDVVIKALTATITAFAQSDQTIASFQILPNDGDLAVRRVQKDEVDMALIAPDALAQPALLEVIGMTGEGKMRLLALWSYSIVPVHSLNLPAGVDLHLEVATIAGIWTGDITRWDHPSIIRSNPALEGTQVLNASITRVVMSEGPRETERIVIQMLSRATTVFSAEGDALLAAPAFNELPFYPTKLQPALEVDVEGRVPEAVSFTPGAVGWMLASETRLNLAGRNTKTVTVVHNGVPVKPTAQARTVCEQDTFVREYNVHDMPTSKNPGCYPFSNYAYALIKAETESNCARVKRSLSFVRELLMRDYNVAEYALSRAYPSWRAKNLELLNAATCDGETVLVVLPEHLEIPKYAADAAVGLGGTLVALSFLAIITTWFYRKRRVIKALSPIFMIVTLCGTLILGIAAVSVTRVTPTEDSCRVSLWLIPVGLYLTFVPLFAKIWRIYRIFFRAEMQVVRLPDWKLLIYIAIPFAGLLGLIAIIQEVDPLRPFDFTQKGDPRDVYFEYCGTGQVGIVLLSIIGVFMGLLVIFGSVMAYSTRSVVHTFNESQAQAFAIYNVILTAIVVAAVSALMTADGPALTLLVAFALFWLALTTWFVVFAPRIPELYKAEKDVRDVRAPSGPSGGGVPSQEMGKRLSDLLKVGVRFMGPDMLRTYVGLLEKELRLAHVQFAQATVQEEQAGSKAARKEGGRTPTKRGTGTGGAGVARAGWSRSTTPQPPAQLARTASSRQSRPAYPTDNQRRQSAALPRSGAHTPDSAVFPSDGQLLDPDA